LFAEVIRYPTFPKEEIERKRAIIISNIRNQLDQPQSLVMRLFRSEMFREHPYGLDVRGTESSVDKLTREDLINYYQNYAVPGNLVIAVVGDVEAEKVRKEMEALFKDWVTEPYAPVRVSGEGRPAEPREVSECKDVNQTNILIGFQGTSLANDDRFSLEVLSSVLSGMSGRLFINLRDKQSLAYSVYAFSQDGLDPGLFAVYIGTAPDKEQAARQGILQELRMIRDQPASPEELKRAREVLIGDFEIRLQRYNTQALHYATDELYGLGFRASEHYAEKIQAVSGADVQHAAQQYLNLEAPVTAVVRPCESTPVSGAESGDQTSSAAAD
jgi:zinc protease